MIDTALKWFEDVSLSVAIRQSTWMYPALEIVHIAGIILLVGPAFMFDLRLLGAAKKLPVALLADYLLSWSRRGLLLVFPSGLLLFVTNATTLAYDRVFWLKMILLLLAALNALLFHRFTVNLIFSQTVNTPGKAAKAAAIASILLWVSIIACGRLLAY